MVKKRLEVFFIMFSAVLIIMIVFSPSCSSCGKKGPTYEEQFNLKRFELRQFDLYNPFLNNFKIAPNERLKYPDYYSFDAYFDDNDIVRYSFYRTESYGYLQEFIYNNEGKLSQVKIYSILVDSIDKGADIIMNNYYYMNGELKAFKDELNGDIFIINGDSVFMYKGIISPSESFSVKRINPNEYFKKLLH